MYCPLSLTRQRSRFIIIPGKEAKFFLIERIIGTFLLNSIEISTCDNVFIGSIKQYINFVREFSEVKL